MAQVAIVGSGVVGTATGKGFVAQGHHVEFVDVAPGRVAQLQAEGLNATDRLSLSGVEPWVVFLTVPTPHVGRRYDLSYIQAAAAAVGQAIAASPPIHTVVVRSTVPPGTCEGLVLATLRDHSGKDVPTGFRLASNPEFLRAASAAEDFLQPWMTVVGSRDQTTRALLRDLLLPFGGEFEEFENPAECEMVKCAHNLYNAAKISFWNDMWMVSSSVGLDSDRVADVVSRSAEGSFNRRYGIRGGAPYGGACLPKDTNGFYGFAASLGFHLPTLNGVIQTNDALERVVEAEASRVVDIRDGVVHGSRQYDSESARPA